MNKAIFLDRDGVINIDQRDYTYRLEDFIFTKGLGEALQKFRDMGYLLIVITNQGGIAKKLYDYEDVAVLHHALKKHLMQYGVYLKAIYYCPHHTDFGKCLCRKPGSLMLEKAIARFDIDASNSYFIGDTDRDMEAGKRAGVKTIKVEPNGSLLNLVLS